MTDQNAVDASVEDAHIFDDDVATVLDVQAVGEERGWSFDDDICEVGDYDVVGQDDGSS